MTTSCHEIREMLAARLEGQAKEYFNGMCREYVNEWIIYAQDNGLDAAVAEIEACVAEPRDDIEDAEGD